ncbi:MAG: PhoH family protein [Defluviitaleaceae bacterium]|nr:PhoH family protein [Defluviitaleaceae bacterium]
MDNKGIINLFGELDSNIVLIENSFDVKIINRDGDITITGDEEKTHKAYLAIEKLISIAKKEELITEQSVTYTINSIGASHFSQIDKLGEKIICITQAGKRISPKTINQKKYIQKIKDNTITFGVGPAGTGKTYLGMAMAITSFKEGSVNRIILTRPAIEAGENLGFLPGDLQQKIDPYLRPLYDALNEIMGQESFKKHQEKDLIEVAPLAYMRGRTLNNSFIFLDEAQNTTPEQMKMFLTRIGFGSKAIVTGDITQIDLPFGKKSGLVEAIKIVEKIDDIAIVNFNKDDVVRHPLVQKIIDAYEKHEKKELPKNNFKRQRYQK